MKDIMTNMVIIAGLLFIPLVGILSGFWWNDLGSPNDQIREEARYKLKRIAVTIALFLGTIIMFFFLRDKVFS
jgi:hypothetical protein